MADDIKIIWNNLNSSYKRNKPFYLHDYNTFEQVIKLYKKGYSVEGISSMTKRGFSTIYRMIRELKNKYGLMNYKETEFQRAMELIDINGFTKVTSPHLERKIRRSHPELELIKISTGVGMEGRKYSSTSLFGLKPRIITFVVKDSESFRYHVAKLMEGFFYEKNPEPDTNIKKAFTHYLHSFGFAHTTDMKLKMPKLV